MSSKWRIVALVAAVMLGWCFVSQSGGQIGDDLFGDPAPKKDSTLLAEDPTPTPKVQWEYYTEIDGVFRNDKANALGRKGWELVTLDRQHDNEVRTIYKRHRTQ